MVFESARVSVSSNNLVGPCYEGAAKRKTSRIDERSQVSRGQSRLVERGAEEHIFKRPPVLLCAA